ncbi:hypothetical protein [Streptomyces sp. NPDC092952]|uniref:hypothetical protein n=1 Tax=Streptomyces sp. NPDC092952 TaxID=3366018 RepID=UPI003803BCCE
MYAPVPPPMPTPPRRVPGRAWIVSMRVLFPLLTVGSIGLLLWTPLLRLAIVRRRAVDWWLTGAGFVFVCVLLPILGRDGSEEPTGIDNVLIPLLLLVMAGSIAYYLVGDIRHYDRLTKTQHPAPGYAYVQTVPVLPSSAPAPAPAAFPPQQQRQMPQPPQQQQPQPQHQQQQPQSQQQQPQPPQPQQQPQRIEQVRAELDELSDYLRKAEGR